MRHDHLFRISATPADVDGCHQRGESGGDVHDRSAGEVEYGNATAEKRIEKTALTPYHMRHWEVDQKRPQHGEDEHRAEANTFGERTGDQRRSNDGEHGLIDHERLVRDSGGIGGIRLATHVVKEEVLKSTQKGRAGSEYQA